MTAIRPCVDDWNPAPRGNLQQVLVTLHPQDHQREPILQVPSNVFDGFVDSEFSRNVGNRRAHLLGAQLKGYTVAKSIPEKPKRDALVAQRLRHRLSLPESCQFIGPV